MTDAAPIPADLDDLLGSLRDGSITPDAFARLDALLASDPAARRTYLEYMHLCSTLRRRPSADRRTLASQPVTVLKPDLSPPRTKVRIARSNSTTWSIAAALLLTAAAVAIYAFVFFNPQPEIRNPKSTGPAVATLIDSTGDVFADDDIAYPGSDIYARTVSITSGSADFLLTNRVGVKLTGSTSLTFHSNMTAMLSHGAAEFNCPPGTKGFTVHLPDGPRVIDLGTAFGVSTGKDRRSRIQVSDGSVRVEWTDELGAESSLVLREQESAIIVSDNAPGTRVVRAINGVISIDFNLGDSPTAEGDASHRASRFTFNGEQVGAWNVLDMGAENRVRSNRALSCDSLKSGVGYTTSARFDFNTGRGYWMPAYDPEYGDPLRDDRLNFSGQLTRGDLTPVQWRIDGLVPSAEYKLILFSPKYQGKTAGQSPVFSVQGTAPDQIDGERDTEYSVGVSADDSGAIHGTVSLPPDHGDMYFGWSGVQIHGPLPIPTGDERAPSSDPRGGDQ